MIPRVDRDYFDPENEHRRPPARTDADRLRRRGSHLVFADSVAPILESGIATMWEDSYRIDANLILAPAPGHTPGSSVLKLSSGTDRALFVGDLLHSPVQVAEPAANSCFCENQAEARATRIRLLDEAAGTGALVVPAHFPGQGAAEVRKAGDSYQLHSWAAFDPVRPG
ncbi:MBL fold metallo-hydrolase [Amycolatopsis sp. NPDC051061]|uniref:MBL fold metallo-hydrolase n=1 Tax=Amycolatopsis sp. NPDC051061 TaxID=3155042 RepID=UPI003418211A